MIQRLLLLLSISACFSVNAANNLTSLSDNGIDLWEPEIFSGESVYSLHFYKDRTALKATSDSSASGLVLKTKIDLLETPYLNWSWLAENNLPSFDEHTKEGDDYVARIYVVIDGGLFVWNTKSLSYVWSSNQSEGQVWDNAYAGSKLKMISVRGQDSQIGQWYNEKRNVYHDLIDHFGDKGSKEKNLKAYRYIDVIAIMTDTDNSGSKAEAYYGDIIFSVD